MCVSGGGGKCASEIWREKCLEKRQLQDLEEAGCGMEESGLGGTRAGVVKEGKMQAMEDEEEEEVEEE